jgi:hypothetical protein
MEHNAQAQQNVLTKRSGRIAFAILAIVLVVLPMTGCILSPREPDGPPGGGTEIPWEPPTDTDAVLRNLSAALTYQGASNYLDCFTEDYRFFADPQDSLDAGQEAEYRYANWTKDDENVSINSIFLDSAQNGISVVFENVTSADENAEETYRRDDYELTILWQHGPHEPGEAVTYRGQVTLWMRKDNTERWSIFRWVDRRHPDQGNSPTWGVLRGDYR